MSIISENIRYLRSRNDLTQEQLARRIGTKRPNIGAYEEARANPPREALIKLSQLFGVSIDQLLTTDLRRIRDTPSLDLGPAASPPPPPVFKPETPRPPQPIQKVVDTYLREKSQVQLVAQRVTLRKLNRLDYGPLPVVPPIVERRKDPVVLSEPVREVREAAGIRLVRRALLDDYLHKFRHPEFIRELPDFQWPFTGRGTLRAFEAGDDFVFPGAIVVGEKVEDWFTAEDGKHYLIVANHHGFLYRRIYNELKIKNTLLLSSDSPGVRSMELPVKDILEIWAVKGFFSQQLPEPALSIDRVRSLVDELRLELERVKR